MTYKKMPGANFKFPRKMAKSAIFLKDGWNPKNAITLERVGERTLSVAHAVNTSIVNPSIRGGTANINFVHNNRA